MEAKDVSVVLDPSPNLVLLFNQFSYTSPAANDDPDNAVYPKYYTVNEIQSLKVANKNKSLTMIYINACSLNKNFDH